MAKLFVQVLEEGMRSDGCCHKTCQHTIFKGVNNFFTVTICYYVTVSEKKDSRFTKLYE